MGSTGLTLNILPFPILHAKIEQLSHDQRQVLQDIDSVTSYEHDIHERSDDSVLFLI